MLGQPWFLERLGPVRSRKEESGFVSRYVWPRYFSMLHVLFCLLRGSDSVLSSNCRLDEAMDWFDYPAGKNREIGNLNFGLRDPSFKFNLLWFGLNESLEAYLIIQLVKHFPWRMTSSRRLMLWFKSCWVAKREPCFSGRRSLASSVAYTVICFTFESSSFIFPSISNMLAALTFLCSRSCTYATLAFIWIC